jgi:hypothetical protein
MRILGREPAAWLGLIAVLVQTLIAWGVPLTEMQQAGINAVATLSMGLLVAASVAREQVIPIAGALLVAVLQLAVAFGADLSQERIAMAGGLLTAALAFYLRTQVVARTGPVGEVVPRETPASQPGQ